MFRVKFILLTRPSDGSEHEEEVRRSKINENCSFDELTRKLGDWGEKLHYLTYTDADGDKVTMTGSDDWEECKELRLSALVDDPLRPLVIRVYLDRLTKRKICDLHVPDRPPLAQEETESPPIPVILDAVFERQDVLRSLKEGTITPDCLGASEWLLIKRTDSHLDVDINLKFLYDLMIAKGVACLGHNDIPTSTTWFTRCTLVLPQNPLGWYNLACCCAVSGLVNLSITHLERAFDCGYSKPAHLISDPDLEPIRGHPKFVSLLNRVTPSMQMLRTRRSSGPERHVNFLISEESDTDEEDDESTPFLGTHSPLASSPEDPFQSMPSMCDWRGQPSESTDMDWGQSSPGTL